MNLHEHPEIFRQLITLTAADMHLPESAIERDYSIVRILKNLENSEYADRCVFKGGTSLSKCYPSSIERFSEDIDLTFLGMELSNRECSKTIKKIEKVMTVSFCVKKIDEELSDRSKSMLVWSDDFANKIKLEIGSSIRPDPYSKKVLKSYIHEFLEKHDGQEDIERFELEEVTLNVLNIERTFVDKLMSVKRHAICGTLKNKVRHIYDIYRLYQLPEIKEFLADTEELKRLIRITKDTDSFYLNKRNIRKEYDPTGAYAFEEWSHYFTPDIISIYENLHRDLLYTNEAQQFEDALEVFRKVNEILQEIKE